MVQHSGSRLLSWVFVAPLLLVAATIFGQSLRYPLSAGYTRLGVYSNSFADALSCKFNQAVLASIQSAGAAVYGEKRFGLQELGLYHAALAVPVSFGGIGISATYFGYTGYTETQFGIAYGKKLGKVDAGIQANSKSVQIPGYGKDGLITVEGGIVIHLSEQLNAGFHVFNPTGSKFGNNRLEKLSSIFTAGLGFEPSKTLFLGGEMIKETGKPVHLNLGLQYLFSKRIFIRLGVYSESPTFYMGTGFTLKLFRLDFTASYHPQLGVTPGILLVFESKDKEE